MVRASCFFCTGSLLTSTERGIRGECIDSLEQGPFDLILASDVAYDHRAVAPLIATLTALGRPAKDCCAPTIMLAYRCSDVLTSDTIMAEQKFFSQLASVFSVVEAPIMPMNDRYDHVQLYILSLR